MHSPDLRALIDRALTGRENDGIADPTTQVTEERVKSAAVEELLRIAERLLDELTAPFSGERWGDHSVSDLRQIVLQKCAECLDGFRGQTEGEFRSWLDTMAGNARKNLIRRAASRRPKGHAVISAESLHDGSECETGIPEPATDELTASKLLQLRIAVAQLSQQDRRIIELRYERELTIKQIAALVGRDERTIRRDLDRIRDRLRTDVEPPQ